MTEPEIYEALNHIFRQVLEDDAIALTPGTTAPDVDGWDSMNHIFIIVEAEKHFGIKLHAAEIEEQKSVSDLVALIQRKLAMQR